jgi:signal transduction histidine kinase
VLDELRAHGRPLLRQRLELSFQGLDRRVRAWREVTNQILPNAAPLASTEPRLIRDQYAQLPFLLYYGVVEATSGERLGVALQLDQQRVLNDFLASTRTYSADIVITDASGTWVLGARRQGGKLAAQVPFFRTLEHLRVGLYPDSLEARAADLSEQWIVPLVITTFLLVIGFFALSSQIAAQRRLRELLERQREFTTRVTHELKTPVAGIKVMAENLELGAFKDEATRITMARRIVEEADRLTSRIDEVLATTQERQAPDPVVFDLEESIYELIDVWVPRLEQHEVAIEVDIDEAPEIRGDPEAVRDAIGCLLDNALKYRDPDRDDPQVWLSLGRDGRDAVVTVTDNGLGVPKAQREQIFARFVRVEGEHRGLSGGHGLGLAQVAETAREHGGSITCVDGVDGGVSFVLRLRGVKS